MKRGCKIALWIFAGVVLMLAAGVGFLAWAMFADKSKYQEHLSQFEGLPPTASDITVYTNLNITGTVIAEFSIQEADFSSWAKSHDWKLSEITEPVSICIPYPYKGDDPLREAFVEQGLYASHHASNGGGIDVAFDRRKNLAIICRSSR